METFFTFPDGAWWILPILSLPHIFYYVLWNYPSLWINVSKNLSRKQPTTRKDLGDVACDFMATVAHILKLIQFTALFIWFNWYAPGVLSFNTLKESPIILGILLIIVGQTFNAAIYNQIGKSGVYYGNKFGATLGPWCTGFPFNVPGLPGRHPQYFGVLLTIWGSVFLVWHPLALSAGLINLTIFWSCCYVFTGIVEQSESTKR